MEYPGIEKETFALRFYDSWGCDREIFWNVFPKTEK